ncbi:MAG: hypothetical protein DMG83_19410 [Acidobacteria bacterium]|nr:MAG: hypothetical protein DMG83_19410 [Acidobacteriota bacterium]
MAIFGLKISDCLQRGTCPSFFGKNLTSKGNTWRTKALTVLVEMPPAVCEIEAAAGSFDFVRLAPHCA